MTVKAKKMIHKIMAVTLAAICFIAVAPVQDVQAASNGNCLGWVVGGNAPVYEWSNGTSQKGTVFSGEGVTVLNAVGDSR